MHLRAYRSLLALLVLPGVLLSQSEDGCEVEVTAENREHTITGTVHTECSWPHTPPWGNSGVNSDYGLRIDGYQFPGWYEHDEWYQWNSGTDKYTAEQHFNPPGSGSQESEC